VLRFTHLAFRFAAVTAVALTVGCSAPTEAERPAAAGSQPVKTDSADRSDVKKLIADWPNRPSLGANQMLAKYGAPQEATAEKLVWHNQGPYKRIVVTRLEIPHDFPKPHMDFMAHTIDYRVPADKANALMAYDGSVTIDRTAGEISARCDLEGHNILTLNLAHDIATGKKSAEQARKAFGENVVQDVLGNNPPYVTALQFQPSPSPADPDTPVIPGSPKRMGSEGAVGTSGSNDAGDAEVLGFIGAVDDNEILAAAEAAKEKLNPQIASYALMLHKAHGQHLVDTMKLGVKIGVTPADTEAVDKLRVKGAGELAALVPLDGDEFGRAYIDAMVKGHTEVVSMIDSQLMKNARNADLQQHLKATRDAVATHLEEAKRLQAETKR